MRCGRGAPSPGPACRRCSIRPSARRAGRRADSRRRGARSRSARSPTPGPTGESSSVVVDGVEHPVVEEVTAQTPFATLRRFRKVGAARAAARPRRGADVRPLRDALARHGANAAARPRRPRHRLAQRPRRAALGGPLRPRRVHRSHDRVHRPRSAPARTSSRSASPASPRSPRPRSWPRTITRRSRRA